MCNILESIDPANSKINADYKIETVTPEKVYVLHYEKGIVEYEDMLNNYNTLRDALPERSHLIFLPKEMDLKEMDIEEIIWLRDYLDDYIKNLPVNIE